MTSLPAKTTATPTADESAAILADHLRRKEPFFYVRYGDGAIECIYDEARPAPHTCDGEVYTKTLAEALLSAWTRLETSPHKVFAGDWQSASFVELGRRNNREKDRWTALTLHAPFEFIHFEALLLMRESRVLVDFYRAVRDDRRRKVYMGPHPQAAQFLRAQWVRTPMVTDLIRQRDEYVLTLQSLNPDVVLYGAGMAGNVIAVDYWDRRLAAGMENTTCISLGSAFDPLFGKKSRSQQLPAATLRRMFRGML